MRATFISKIIPHVVFSFDPDGLLYISKGTRYHKDSVFFCYARLDKTYYKTYKRDEAFATPVFVYESTRNIFLSNQPEKTVFELDICTREILTEKTGSSLRQELKRMQKDSVYFYMKYCHIRKAQGQQIVENYV